METQKAMKIINIIIFSSFLIAGLFMLTQGKIQIAFNIIVTGVLYLLLNKVD